MSVTPQHTVQDTDLLLKFEMDNIPAEYRHYYRTSGTISSLASKASRKCGDTTSYWTARWYPSHAVFPDHWRA